MTTEGQDKIELLLDMVEHPERYSEQELEQLLADEECRETYSLMTDVRSGYESRNAEQITDELVDEEWDKFARQHYPNAAATSAKVWRKMAAAIVGVLFLSGIAYAAIYINKVEHKNETTMTEVAEVKTIAKNAEEKTVEKTDTLDVQPRQFEDATLEEIVGEMAAYYHLKADFRNEELKAKRFYFRWNPQDEPEKAAEALSMFEHVSVSVSDGSIIVE